MIEEQNRIQTTTVADAASALAPWWRAPVEFYLCTRAVVELEVRKLGHDPTELITRAVQPALWLLVFGSVFTKIHAIQIPHMSYMAFMAPGVLAQSVLFVAIFYGISSIRERDTGIIVKFLVSPAPRSALVLGKALSAGVRAMSQAVIVFCLAWLEHVQLDWNPLALLGVILLVLLGAVCFSMFSLIVASLTKTQERFMGVGQLMTMPLFFASNALYPISLMPRWLQIVSHVNPLTYQVEGLRMLMLAHGAVTMQLAVDYGILFATAVLLVSIAGKLYAQIVT